MKNWEESAKAYSKSFKGEESLAEVRELAYMQAIRHFKEELLKVASKITYPEVPAYRVSPREMGFEEGVKGVLKIIKENL